MKEFKSQQQSIQRSAEDVFDFVTNFDQLGKLMPERVENWMYTHDTCSFELKGMAKLQMRVQDKQRPTLLSLKSDGKNPFEYLLKVDIIPANEMRSEVVVSFHADLNPMLSMMASKPLQNLVELIVDKLKEEMES